MSDIVNDTIEAVLQGGAPGARFYATTQGEDGVFVFDPSDQAAAFQLTAARGMGFLSILQVGATFYLSARGANGLFELADPQQRPTQIAATAGKGFIDMALVGGTLYLTAQEDGIYKYDPATQAPPAKIASTSGLGFRSVIDWDDKLYLTTHGSDGIWEFRLDTEATPVQLPNTAGLGFNDLLANRFAEYPHLLLTTQGHDGVYRFNIATHEIGPTPMHAGQAFEGIASDGSRILLASQAGDGGIWTDQGQLSKTRGYGFRRIAGPVPSGQGAFPGVV